MEGVPSFLPPFSPMSFDQRLRDTGRWRCRAARQTVTAHLAPSSKSSPPHWGPIEFASFGRSLSAAAVVCDQVSHVIFRTRDPNVQIYLSISLLFFFYLYISNTYSPQKSIRAEGEKGKEKEHPVLLCVPPSFDRIVLHSL